VKGGYMTLKENLVNEIAELSELQLQKLEEYVAFLKFHSRFMSIPSFDEHQIAMLYKEFTREDIELAEQGMNDYENNLIKEDST
jgi:hypothetical protein